MNKFGKFTAETQELIVNGVRNGAFVTSAAKVAGVSRATLDDWLRAVEPEFLEFQRRVRDAQDQARLTVENYLRENDPQFWQRYVAGLQGTDEQVNVEKGQRRPARRRQKQTQPQVMDKFPWNRSGRALREFVAKEPELLATLADVLALPPMDDGFLP